ncbi:class II aldolase/adducin family protein [Albimonas pacifica]|uniref:HCOMODA/2-hydroxy-3-carboxy-muconic semialdehyde decarboxylase n=1 Tax=Albimonas pacifica TaxID=1114924 RepID=A0A1I3M011_9RHOB|nr:class II aldolase/adducin family protein [Albimonas pacifica]SFI90312.1 HCOMODA/2-hydroxy-3-carboxy-muconic semialdehyde decarboxylase [Albimonas pacifica]
MTARPEALLADLALLHRLLVAQGVLDAFGHASVRDPSDPGVFWLTAAQPPSATRAADFLPHDLSGGVRAEAPGPLFAERWIHAEVYAQRPDVHAVVHHHAPAILPFCLSDVPLVPVSQTGGWMGGAVPVWDSATHFGDTGMLVCDPAQAACLAQTLGNAPMALMRGHGAVVVAADPRELAFRAVHACRDADHQRRARALGGAFRPLSPGEAAQSGAVARGAIERCWSHWTADLSSTSGAPE